MKIRIYFAMKPFFLVLTSNFVEIRNFLRGRPEFVNICVLFELKNFFFSFDEHFFFGLHSRIQRNEVFAPPKNLFMPPQSRYPGAGPALFDVDQKNNHQRF